MRTETIGKLFILLITLQTLATVLIVVCIAFLVFSRDPSPSKKADLSTGLKTGIRRPAMNYQEGESLKPEDKVIASKGVRARSFHRPGCPLVRKIPVTWVLTRKEALEKGFTPCKICNP